jgi:hypothetical protein
MPHDFQAYGDAVPQAAEALARLAHEIRRHTATVTPARTADGRNDR